MFSHKLATTTTIDRRQNTDAMWYHLQNTIRSQTLVEGGTKRQNT